ncbi:MAG: hypothetical protein WCT41_02130 [Candidatus Paceibacterota bacterium]|jgi:hypothetical protein
MYIQPTNEKELYVKKRFYGNLIPMILASGVPGNIDASKLPKKDWTVHSGHAPVAKEEVHSLMSQKIAGTKTLLLQAESGAKFSVTQAEAEVFAADYLTSIGYKVQAPQQA